MTGLADDFAPANEEQWRQLVVASLKGRGFEQLVSRSDDGFDIQPIYERRMGPRATREGGKWRVIARVDHPDAVPANAQALDDLASGADGLQVVFAGACGAYGYGFKGADPAALDALFENIRLDPSLSLSLDLGPRAADQALAVAAAVERTKVDPANVELSFGLDPLGALARSGRAPQDWRGMAGMLGGAAASLKSRGFAGPFVVADARGVHAAGGSPAQELAFALSAGTDYLRALNDNGLDREAARAAIAFRLAADSDEFMSLAKFRALRLLWARVTEASGLSERPVRIHGESAWRMMSARDPWLNVLRGAMGAFCAGLGGADSVSVLPFTQALGLPDAFARRLARNSQLILLEESHLGFVVDPAAGAGAFEAMTEALCETAWSMFQKIEGQGGLYAGLVRGDFQNAVAEAAAGRARDVAHRKAPLIGVSDFPDLDEAKIETLAFSRPDFAYEGENRAAPLVSRRLAEPFEALREASDAALARDGVRPKMFLACLGPPAAFGARASFARGLFEAGGLETQGDDGFATVPEAIAAFKASGAKAACCCSSDEIYAAIAEDAARALKKAGARAVFLAGKPGSREANERAAGVDQFLFAGCDVLAALRAAHESIAVG
jgi:methylmalonyl-CoA mutase